MKENIRKTAAFLLAAVIAGMHHPLLDHNTTQETEFITDTVADSGELAEALADAGIRYIFTGHMHENDIASYTTVEGNTIYDMETGGMVAYGSPIRMVTLAKYADGTEKMTIDTESVKDAAMNAKLDAPNGNVTDTEKVDVLDYELNAMYGENFVSNLIFRYADRYLDQFTDIPAALQNIAGIDLYKELFGLLPSLLAEEMTVDLGGSLGTLHITYSSGGTFQDGDGVHLSPAGTAGLLGSFTVRDSDIQTEVGHILDQVEERYMANGALKERLDGIIEKAKNTVLESEEGHTLYDLLRYMFTVHNTGNDTAAHPDWVQRSLDNLAAGPLLQETVMDIINNDIYPFVDELTGSITIDLNTLFGRNMLWSAAVNAVMGSSSPTLAAALDKFGVDVRSLLDGLLNEYLSDSFFTSVGGVAVNIINGFASDSDGLDDAVDGDPAVLTYDGRLHPNYSVENGMLPDQVTVSLGGNDTKGIRNFSWYTGTKVQSGEVQLLEAVPGMTEEEAEAAFESGEGVVTTTADTATVNKAKLKLNLVLVTNYDIQEANRHTAEVSIEEEKNYYYRVGTTYGNTDCYSQPVLLREASTDQDDTFTFINVADSQGATEADYDKYIRVLHQAEETFEDAEFITHLGDFVDDGNNESYWDWVLNNEEMQSLPVVPVAGNHEARATDDRLVNAIAAHYNVDIPEQDTSRGIYYSFTYENATFIVLNTNDLNGSDQISEAQMAWAESVAKNADTTWKILLTHKAPYSKGPHYNDSDVIQIRQQLNQLAAEGDIDIVLSGHDHTYLRTPYLLDGKTQQTDYTDLSVDGITYRTAVNPEGTVFVIPSASGVKYYEFNEAADVPAEVAGQPGLSVYGGITIEGDTLYYRAYTEDGSLYDSFAIRKGEEEVSAVQQVINMIKPFRDGVTLEDEAADAKAAAAVEALIEVLPDTEELTLENADAAEEALKAYEALTDAQKKLVSEEYSDKLEAALEQIAKLEQAEADKDAADKVDQMILALPAEITLADEQTVTAAREAYDSLTPEQKPYVQNLEQLEQAEKTIADLKEADRNAAQNVMDAIDAFGDAISLDDKEALQAVKGQYEKLTDVQKQLVTNYDRLEQLLDQLARLEKEESDKDAAKEAEEIIDALPDEITLQDEAAVNAAREAYDALTEGQKAYVGNLEKLLQAEARIVSLKGSADHTGNHISTGNNASAGTGGAGAGDGQSRNPGADEKAVQTGDPSPLMLWTALALAGGTAAAAGLYFRRKRKL